MFDDVSPLKAWIGEKQLEIMKTLGVDESERQEFVERLLIEEY